MKTSTIPVVLATAAFAATACSTETPSTTSSGVELTTLPEQVNITVDGDTTKHTSGEIIEIPDQAVTEDGQARVIIHQDGFNAHSKMLDVTGASNQHTHALLPHEDHAWATWCDDLEGYPDADFHDAESQC